MKNHSDSQSEDVASLFRKFGGDVRDYKEFAPAAEPVRPTSAANAASPWPMPSGPRPSAAANEAAPQPVALVFPVAPVATILTPAITPSKTPDAYAAAVPALPAPRQLDALFRRLAGSPPVATPAHSLMSRWRRPA